MEKQMERFRLNKTAEEISLILNSFDDKEDKLKKMCRPIIKYSCAAL